MSSCLKGVQTMRLIDADALESHMNNRLSWLVKEYGRHDHYTSGYGDGVCAVEDAPTIDAVEVARCKDCKHGEFEEENRMWACMRCAEYDEHLDIFTGFIDYHNEDHFCSYGERRENA